MTENDKLITSWLEAHLLQGKFIVIPEVIYDMAIKMCREAGMCEAAIRNIYKSENCVCIPDKVKVQ